MSASPPLLGLDVALVAEHHLPLLDLTADEVEAIRRALMQRPINAPHVSSALDKLSSPAPRRRPMSDATLTIVRDEAGERCVVTHADDVIWIVEELWAELTNPQSSRPRIWGDAELDGDLLTFGTEGEGLGRLTYRRTGEVVSPWGHIVCKRVKPRRVRTQAEPAGDDHTWRAAAHPWQEYNAYGNTCHYTGCRMTEEEHEGEEPA